MRIDVTKIKRIRIAGEWYLADRFEVDLDVTFTDGRAWDETIEDNVWFIAEVRSNAMGEKTWFGPLSSIEAVEYA